MRLGWMAAMILAFAGCGADEARSGSDGTGGGSGSGGSGGGTSKPPPGPSADGWDSAYVDGGKASSCSASAADMDAAGLPKLVFGDSALYAGFEQVGDNQNPFVARFDGGTPVWCEVHETEPPDGRAVGITWNGGDHAYVVYTVVGGGTSLEGKGGWLSSYAPGAVSGGGSKVSVVGRVATANGALDRATFVIAIKSDNKVNSHGPAGAVTVLTDGSVEFLGGSAHKPVDIDTKPMDCTDYPFDSRYRFSADLSQVLCADCTNCNAKQPCGS